MPITYLCKSFQRMSLKLFIDHASQPSRSILVFCKAAKIPFDIVQTRISRGDHLKPDFAKVNPQKKIPAIVHEGFSLAESHAIMRYLARTFNVAQHWYPRTDFKKAAKIDEYLDYHHTGTRQMSSLVFWTAFAPNMGLSAANNFNPNSSIHEVERTLDLFDNYFLSNTSYISTNEPSIADLSAYQELNQLKFIDYDLKTRSKIVAWMNRMEQIEATKEENAIFNKLVNAFNAKQKKTHHHHQTGQTQDSSKHTKHAKEHTTDKEHQKAHEKPKTK